MEVCSQCRGKWFATLRCFLPRSWEGHDKQFFREWFEESRKAYIDYVQAIEERNERGA